MASVTMEGDRRGTVVVAEGDVDMTLASELESALEEAAAGESRVVVDLSATTLLDSRAIGILLAWSERLGASGGGLALVAATPEVRRLFAVIGLDREFRFCADRDEALTG